MSPDQLLKHFETISEADVAVLRLRRFILDLAVRGKLVNQSQKDECAKDLLKRIEQQRVLRVKSGQIRGRKEIAEFDRQVEPFSLPQNWSWAQFGQLVEFSAGRTPSRHNSKFWNTGDYPWACIADMKDGRSISATKETISKLAKNEVFKGEPSPPGTILMSFKLTIGKVSRLAVPAYHNEAIISVYPHIIDLDAYLFRFLPLLSQSGTRKDAIKGSTLNRETLGALPIPLPPLAEQHRIVAKVDELMALCDELEAAQTKRETRRDHLVAATLHRLNNGDTSPEVSNGADFKESARFYFNHLSRLTARSEHIKRLRQTILNLAIQGRLVQQVVDDGPVSKTLAEVKSQRHTLRDKEYPPVGESEAPFEIPKSWMWVRLGNIALKSDSGWSPQCDSGPRSGTNWGVLKVSAVSWGEFKPEENKALPRGKSGRVDAEVKRGDFLLSRANTDELVARSVVVAQTPPRLMMSDKIVRFTFPDSLAKRFINIANLSSYAREYYARNASGTSSSMKNIGRDVMCNLPIPFPPLAEQHRIVTKVDELMALCDELEAQITTTATTRRQLLEMWVRECLKCGSERNCR